MAVASELTNPVTYRSPASCRSASSVTDCFIWGPILRGSLYSQCYILCLDTILCILAATLFDPNHTGTQPEFIRLQTLPTSRNTIRFVVEFRRSIVILFVEMNNDHKQNCRCHNFRRSDSIESQTYRHRNSKSSLRRYYGSSSSRKQSYS